ncbi:MAG: RHS repeat protein, partial [Gammaproteobacteria bacterium]|nr:RHS repeat protein [Gammaproteobacteria bacterium]
RNGAVMEYGFAQSTDKIYLTRSTDLNGDSLEFGYNANGLLGTITDALGRVTTLEYATLAVNIERVNKITDPFGRAALFGYDAALNLTEITDMGSYKSTLGYDDNLNIASITRPQFGTWLFDIEPIDSDKLEIVGDIVSIYWNPYPAPGSNMRLNERITITDPNDNKTEYYYDGAKKQSWVVLPNHYREYETS